jgi:hypothetical protein
MTARNKVSGYSEKQPAALRAPIPHVQTLLTTEVPIPPGQKKRKLANIACFNLWNVCINLVMFLLGT